MRGVWVTASIDSACNVEYGTRVVKKRDGGTVYPVYGGGGETFRVDSHNREDRVVISRFGMSPKCVRRVHGRFFLNDSGLTLSPRDEKCLAQDYLDYLSFQLNDTIYALGKGQAQRNLDVPAFRELRISFPKSLLEQKRIVAILDEGLKAIETAKQNADKSRTRADALFKGLLDRAIQGKLVAPSAGADAISKLFEEIQRCREVKLGKAKVASQDQRSADSPEAVLFTIPGTWKWCPLSSLTLAIADGVHKTPKYVDHGVPFVTVKNLTVGSGISFEEVNYITREDHLEFIKRTHPEKGDILISKDGTIGVVRFIESEVEFSIFVSVALIKPAHSELGRFLAYALSAPCVQSQIVPKGAALKHLYLVDLRRLTVPLPPLEDQRRIVETLDNASAATRQLGSIYERKMVVLEKLKASLLTSALSAAS